MKANTDGYVDFLERQSKFTLLLVALITLVAGAGISRLEFDNDYRGWVGEQNEERLLLDELEATFEKDDSVMFILASENNALSQRYLLASLFLTERAWSMPHVLRVNSVTNYQRISVEQDDISVADLLDPESAVTHYDEEELATELLANPALIDRLISGNRKITAVVAKVHLPDGIGNVTGNVTSEAKKIAAAFREKFPEITLHLNGSLMINDAFTEASRTDVRTLFPIMYLIFFIGIYVWLRSVRAVLVCWAMVSMSLVATMGIVGWSDISLNAGNAAAPTIVMTVVLANCIHVFTVLIKHMANGETQSVALRSSIRSNMRPIFLTMVTTVLGFLALCFSESPPYRSLGVITAIGVFTGWVYLMLFVPVILGCMRIDFHAGQGRYSWTGRLARLVTGNYKVLGPGFAALAIMLAAFIPRIELNDNPREYIDESMDFRKASDFMTRHFTGAYALSFKVTAAGPGDVNEPEYMQGLEKLAAWLRTWPEVRNVNSASDTIKRLNRAFNRDDPAYYRIPDSRPLIAQYLLLYEMSLPYGHSLDDMFDMDKSATRLDVSFGDVDFQTLRAYKARIEQWMTDNLPPYMHSPGTGPSALFASITRNNIISMINSTALLFLVITLIIVISLGDWRAGAYSTISNILPLLMAYGLWAVLVTKAGLAISIVSALGIGIIVDDTIHFLSKYFHARKDKQLDPEAAILYTFDTVGPALIGTSIILAAGFALLAFSDFEINASMGLFTASTVLFAILADFVLLPSVLLAWDRRGIEQISLTRMPRDNPVEASAGPIISGTRKAYTEGE